VAAYHVALRDYVNALAQYHDSVQDVTSETGDYVYEYDAAALHDSVVAVFTDVLSKYSDLFPAIWKLWTDPEVSDILLDSDLQEAITQLKYLARDLKAAGVEEEKVGDQVALYPFRSMDIGSQRVASVAMSINSTSSNLSWLDAIAAETTSLSFETSFSQSGATATYNESDGSRASVAGGFDLFAKDVPDALTSLSGFNRFENSGRTMARLFAALNRVLVKVQDAGNTGGYGSIESSFRPVVANLTGETKVVIYMVTSVLLELFETFKVDIPISADDVDEIRVSMMENLINSYDQTRLPSGWFD
jgi:hypothetical protein